MATFGVIRWALRAASLALALLGVPACGGRPEERPAALPPPGREEAAAQFSGLGSESPRLSESKIGGVTVSRVEVGGTYTPSPMSMMGGPAPQPKPGYILLGAIVPGPDSNWFFKCTGPEKTMKANRER